MAWKNLETRRKWEKLNYAKNRESIRRYQNAWQNAWRARNLEKAREQDRDYYRKNWDKIRPRANQYQNNHVEQRRKYRSESAHYKAYVKSYNDKNKDRLKEYHRKYYKAHKVALRSKRAEYQRNRRATNIVARIRHSLASRLTQAVRRKYGRTINIIGCPIEDLKIYLESKFEPGMTWENYGRGDGRWHIDHIIPCALFDLSKPEHQYRCFHFSNLQPLWGIENLTKGKKTSEPQLRLL